MSLELIQLYKQLNLEIRETLNKSIQKAPKMGLLFQLLASQNFNNTNKALSFIYAQELAEGLGRELLLNRFYKLCEKAKELLTDCFKNTSAGLSAAEKELHFASFLVAQKQYSQAVQRLKELEKTCWEQNLFELLPSVYEQLLQTVQGVEPLDKTSLEGYYAQRKNAIQLRNQLEIFWNYAYELQLQPENYNEVLKQIRERLKLLKPYPRFELIYHYLAIRAGVLLEVVNNNPKSALSRHFNQLRQILKKHPQLPLLGLSMHQRDELMVRMLNAEVLFWYARADKPKIKQAVEQLLELPNLFSYCTERDLFNLCLMTIQSKFFAQARRLLDLLAQFQEMQYAHESDAPWQYFELVWYCKQYPAVQPPNIAQYIQKIVQQIETRSLEYTPNPVVWVHGILIVYAILYGDLATAEKILYMPICVAYGQKMVLPPDVAAFFGLVKTANFAELLEFQNKMLAQSKDKNLKISHRKHYELLGEAAQGVLNQKKNY